MDAIINIDRLTQWCVIVRLRGRNISTRNPLHENMDVLDERVSRADHADDESLCRARRELISRMLHRILIDGGALDPIADIEGLAIINNYSIAYYAALGDNERARRLAANPLTLIAEDDAAGAEAKTQAAGSDALPRGRVINGSASRPITPADVS